MKRFKINQLFSIFISLVMVISIFPTFTFAAETILVDSDIIKIEPHRANKEGLITSSADVLNIRLIEKGYIEIMWSVDMTAAPARASSNFKLTDAVTGDTIGFSSGNWSYYRWNPSGSNFAQSTIFFTSLRLNDWQNMNEEQMKNFHAKLQFTGNLTKLAGGSADTSIVYDVVFDSFYEYIYDFHGIRINGSANCTKETVERCARILETMLAKDQKEFGGIITTEMSKFNMDLGLIGTGECAYFLPGQRSLTQYDNRPAGGLAATRSLPTATFGHNSPGTAVHEIGHTVKALGLAMLEDKSMLRAYDDAFMNVKEQKMYTEFGSTFTYGLSNAEEFFAEMSNVWFNTFSQNNSRPTSRQAMEVYDPMLYAALSQFYYPVDAPGASTNPSTFRTPATRIFVSEPGIDDDGKISYMLDDSHWFKMYSHFGSHCVQSNGNNGLSTWWDFSHSDYNYTFNAMRWRLIPVVEDGVVTPYYSFRNEAGNRAMAPLSVTRNVVGQPVGMVTINMNDHNQHWELVQVKGRYAQIVNRASGLVMTTLEGALPGDGTTMVFGEYSDAPLSGAIWRMMRLKDTWTGGTRTSLHSYDYAVIPTKRDIKLERIFVDPDGFIQINWPEPVPGGSSSYRVSMNGVKLELDESQCAVIGNTTILKLFDEATEQFLNGIGVKLQYIGNAVGETSGLPVNNEITYSFRNEAQAGLYISNATRIEFAKAALTWELIMGDNEELDNIISDLHLPTSMFGTEITWESSHPNLLTNEGELTFIDEGDFTRYEDGIGYNVVLTANITRGSAEPRTVVFDLTVNVPYVSTTPMASVEKINGNQNLLTINVIEHYQNGAEIVLTTTVIIDNNAEGTYKVGDYLIYVNTKGNTQIRDCYIVADEVEELIEDNDIIEVIETDQGEKQIEEVDETEDDEAIGVIETDQDEKLIEDLVQTEEFD